MNKRLVLGAVCAAVCFCVPQVVCAQASIDPSSRFYEYARSWELRGLVTQVPPVRPYPLANIKQILTQVMENGTAADKEIASALWQEETGRAWHLGMDTEFAFKTESQDDVKIAKENALLTVAPSAFGELSFFDDFASMGYRLKVEAFALGDKEGFDPLYVNRKYDWANDPARAGPFTMYIDMNGAVSVGRTDIFLQAGLDRRGYGSFLGSGIVFNDTALHAPNFSFTYIHPRFSFTQMLTVLAASRSYDGKGFTFDKYCAFHAIELNLFQGKLAITYLENTIFGRRFDPSYLLPVPFMAIQTLYDAADNLQMGLALKYRPFPGMQFVAEAFVDDVDFNNDIKLHFDTRNRLALRAGAVYTPASSICTGVELSYLAIMPFMYTHWEYDSATSGRISVGSINYSDYTHYGKSFGTSIPPDSEHIGFTLNLEPTRNLRLKVSSSFMRHGNVAESFTDDEAIKFLLAKAGQYSTDGSVHTHSMFENPDGTSLKVIPTGHYHLNYLTQEHQMYVLHAGLDAEYTVLRKNWGTLSVFFGYTFEFLSNKGVDSHLYPGGQVTANTDGTYKITGGSDSASQADAVAYFKDQWVSGLHNEVNNFFTLGVSYWF